MASAFDVAEYILKTRGSMTAMKLQKLVYYSQAWHLVREDEPLFEEPIQAWAAGPVVRALFDRHRGKFTVSPGDFGGGKELSETARKSIDRVVNHYGGLDANQLSELTHKERPWLEAREGLEPTERGDKEIDLHTMADFYTALAQRRLPA